MASFEDILEKAKEYVSWDPCEETRNQIAALIKNKDGPALQSLIGQRQLFGTAGLRGPMCAGYAGMNYLVVLQTTQVNIMLILFGYTWRQYDILMRYLSGSIEVFAKKTGQ